MSSSCNTLWQYLPLCPSTIFILTGKYSSHLSSKKLLFVVVGNHQWNPQVLKIQRKTDWRLWAHGDLFSKLRWMLELQYNRFYVLEKLKSLDNFTSLYTYMIIILSKYDSFGIDYVTWLRLWLWTNSCMN